MTAKIIKFPEIKKEVGYIIPLFSDEQILLTTNIVNMFSPLKTKITVNELTNLDPLIVIDSLQKGKNSDILSNKSKQIIISIIKSIETIEVENIC